MVDTMRKALRVLQRDPDLTSAGGLDELDAQIETRASSSYSSSSSNHGGSRGGQPPYDDRRASRAPMAAQMQQQRPPTSQSMSTNASASYSGTPKMAGGPPNSGMPNQSTGAGGHPLHPSGGAQPGRGPPKQINKPSNLFGN